jgi:ATP-dependent HslUV protease subunit HslV
MPASTPALQATTVLLVRKDGKVCMASDGQVTLGQSTIIKSGARKIRRTAKGGALVGFAGGGADGLTLFTRLEAKLEEFSGNLERAVVELAKDWRTDRSMRQLDAVMVVANQQQTFFVAGNGELLQPDEEDGGVLAIGSGANFALAAARALLRHTDLSARQVVEEAMKIAADICIYTNDRLTFEEL